MEAVEVWPTLWHRPTEAAPPLRFLQGWEIHGIALCAFHLEFPHPARLHRGYGTGYLGQAPSLHKCEPRGDLPDFYRRIGRLESDLVTAVAEGPVGGSAAAAKENAV